MCVFRALDPHGQLGEEQTERTGLAANDELAVRLTRRGRWRAWRCKRRTAPFLACGATPAIIQTPARGASLPLSMRPIRRLTLAESEPSTDVAPVKSFRGKVKHANLLTISIRATRAVARRSSSRGVAQLLRRHLMISMPACELPSCPRPSDLSC
jgi:hypothetical protein